MSRVVKQTNNAKRTVRLDHRKVDYLRKANEEKIEELIDAELFTDYRMYDKILREEPIFLKTAAKIAEHFKVDLPTILHPDEIYNLGPPATWAAIPSFFLKLADWEPLECLEPQKTVSNGLKIEIWEMGHMHMHRRKGRGKCYDVAGVTPQKRTSIRDYFTRHPDICDRVGSHPRIAKNFAVTHDRDNLLWWVIDEYVGPTLETQLKSKGGVAKFAPKILQEILEGLAILHAADVVYREMSPQTILLRERDHSVVLTDFELAKLMQGRPTVAPKGDWPIHDYRALEIGSGGTATVRADLYSWGRIAVEVLCGDLPTRGKEPAILNKKKIPPAVNSVIQACLELPASKRPDSANDVLRQLWNWK